MQPAAGQQDQNDRGSAWFLQRDTLPWHMPGRLRGVPVPSGDPAPIGADGFTIAIGSTLEPKHMITTNAFLLLSREIEKIAECAGCPGYAA
jgi:hypothetical protein